MASSFNENSPSRKGVGGYYLVFFLAGMPALLYQVVWQRVLTLYFGVDIYSTSITVSAFMLGLGVGALLGGRLADSSRYPARMYMLVEALLGVFGAISLPVFCWVGERMAGSPTWLLAPVDIVLLLIPTGLMGMTLPLMCRIVAREDAAIGEGLAWLYGANTLGAAVGAAITSYLLVGLLGLSGVTHLAACMNVLLAVVVWSLGRRTEAHASAVSATLRGAQEVQENASASAKTSGELHTHTPEKTQLGSTDEIASPGPSFWQIALFSFVSGLLALGYEIVWYRVLTCLLHGTAYVFGTILSVYLCGLGLGALASRRSIDRPGALWRFGSCQLATSCYSAFVFFVLAHNSHLPVIRHCIAASLFTSFHPSPELADGDLDIFALYSAADIVFWSLLILGPPTFCMGYGFPNLIRAGSLHVRELGNSVGLLYFANILGSTLGSLVFGFLGLHFLGMQGCITVLIALGALVSIASLEVSRKERGFTPSPVWRGVQKSCRISVVILLVTLMQPGALVKAVHYSGFHKSQVEFDYLEDRTGVVGLRLQKEVLSFPAQEKSKLGKLQVFIDGAAHGELPSREESVEDPAVQWALSAHAAPQRVLAIGLGDGKMCLAAAKDPRVKELVVIELSHALSGVLQKVSQGRELLASPKVRFLVDDGRRWLLANPEEKFDAILMWPLHAAHAHSGSLYSLEFFHLVRKHLHERGILFLRTADLYSTPRTLAEVFPHVARSAGLEYTASTAPLKFDAALLPEDAREEIRSRVDADRQVILKHAGSAPINYDLRPNSEYYLTYPYRRWLRTRGIDRSKAFRFDEPDQAELLWKSGTDVSKQ